MTTEPATATGTVAVIKIPKVNSGPADPSKASFSVTIPPELRNCVYELLFKCDGLVLLHDAKGCRLRIQPERKYYDSDSEFEADWVDFQEEYKKIIRRDSQPIQRFRDGLGLLSSCRQCFWEAAAVLYGNTFLISRAFTCDLDCLDSCHIAYTGRWVSGLGFQSSLLTRICVDADAICPPQCEESVAYVNILPLLRLIDIISATNIEITFISSGRKWLCSQLDRVPDVEDNCIQATFLNGIIQEMGHKDVFNLKRYMTSGKLLDMVCVLRHGLEGYVQYYPTRPKALRPRREFTMVTDGDLVRIKAEGEGSTTTLSALPSHVLLSIFKYAMWSPKGILIDLDLHHVCGLNVTLMHIDRATRNLVLFSDIVRMNKVTITMRSTSPITSFTSFAILRNCLTKHQLRRSIPRGSRTSIMLNFELEEERKLEQIRINVKKLLRVLSDWQPDTRIHFSCKSKLDEEGAEMVAQATLGDIQIEAFVLLSSILERAPAKRYKSPPQLWVDGYGKVREAIFHAGTTAAQVFPNESLQLSKHAVHALGTQHAKELSHGRMRDFDRRRSQYPNIGKLWLDLRQKHFRNWHQSADV